MKITKKQLKRIIREERKKIIKEQAPRDRVAVEGELLGELNDILQNIEETANELYGLVDPGDPGIPAGDQMGDAIALQIERANSLYEKLVAHFESMDS